MSTTLRINHFRRSSALHLRASLTANDIARSLVLLAPIRLHFTAEDEDTRWVELERPDEATLVANDGLRLVAQGRLRYTVKGVPLEVDIRQIGLMLRPQVVTTDGKDARLAFKLGIDSLDVRNVPSVVDRMLCKAVDAAITPRSTQLVWRFGETLTKVFQLPSRIEPIDGLGLSVTGGSFQVGQKEVTLQIDFAPLNIMRSSERPIDGDGAVA